MKNMIHLFIMGFVALVTIIACNKKSQSTVPMTFDHNRMIVEGKIQKKDGSWRTVRIWVDSGNPTFFISAPLAHDLGYDLTANESDPQGPKNIPVEAPKQFKIGNFVIDTTGVPAVVMYGPFWMFSTFNFDINLPSTILQKYHIVCDYPDKKFTIAKPGSVTPRGTPVSMSVKPETGIIQIDAVIDGEAFSFALDAGSSYSFMSEERVAELIKKHADWQNVTGTLSYANMWGWWRPEEDKIPVIRIPSLEWGGVKIDGAGITGIAKYPQKDGISLGEWYSRKTQKPVDGFLGTNVLKAFRIEIDYIKNLVYFEKGAPFDTTELDTVGVSLRQLPEGTYEVIGVVKKDGKAVISGIEQGDLLVKIGTFETKGKTMGQVGDALRGKPGDIRSLLLERKGKQFTLEVKIEHLL